MFFQKFIEEKYTLVFIYSSLFVFFFLYATPFMHTNTFLHLVYIIFTLNKEGWTEVSYLCSENY